MLSKSQIHMLIDNRAAWMGMTTTTVPDALFETRCAVARRLVALPGSRFCAHIDIDTLLEHDVGWLIRQINRDLKRIKALLKDKERSSRCATS